MNDSIQRLNHICLLILTGIAVTLALSYAQSVLVPLVFSLVIYEALLPLVNFLEKKVKLPSLWATLISFFAFIFIFSFLILFVAVSIEHFVKSADIYKQNLGILAQKAIVFAQNYELVDPSMSVNESIKNLPIFGFLKELASNTAGVIGNISLVGLFVGFLMFGANSSLPENHFFKEANDKIARYLNTKFICSLVTALLVAVILWFFDSDLIMVFALLTFVLNFIPNIGSVFATLLPLPLLALKLGFGVQLLVCTLLIAAVQFVVGNIVEPKMMGESLQLHPIAILVFLLFWGLVWGVPGMFLAIPITASLKILFQRLEATQPLAKLLEGKF